MRSQSLSYLILPGWQGSPDEHWQSHWQRSLPNTSRVEQADWQQPDPHSWVDALERAVAAAQSPVVLIAHSLGCVTVARWAAQAPLASLRKVRGALLVAPADVERPGCPEALQGFAPISRELLPFPSVLVGSDNDQAASAVRALELARDWGSQPAILPGAGHINVKSGHQRWEQGFAYLYRLQQQMEQLQRRSA
ncbi:RBBP9/YdeN family alpha/beta hydrolase [Aquipseudomonas ullengensis]|uniref:Alpha/beta hydrolase n=1 Tax=Aquipseudomonas ullengensis TaxID=2759166 RepID=A0A7W4LPL3_9GAMM|nr:alpha/beta hydrolase [Pseudomonas ullengensis]MBB2496991.1 alpha/beta hydrolase [Pseudomonas ullengensis]